jgi:hypothetical protein
MSDPCAPGTIVDPYAETEEQIQARTERYLKNVRDMGFYEEQYTEEWYRHKYPGFPDHFYPIFVQFSSEHLVNQAKYDGDAVPSYINSSDREVEKRFSTLVLRDESHGELESKASSSGEQQSESQSGHEQEQSGDLRSE